MIKSRFLYSAIGNDGGESDGGSDCEDAERRSDGGERDDADPASDGDKDDPASAEEPGAKRGKVQGRLVRRDPVARRYA